MELLLVGGSGRVAAWIVPELARTSSLRSLDLVRPSDAVALHIDEVTVGDATDVATLRAASRDVDAIVHLATVVPRSREELERADQEAVDSIRVNVASVYTALRAARSSRGRHVVHVSTMSVHARYGAEQVKARQPADAVEPYGLGKRLAEMVCAAEVSRGGVTATSLRLAFPTPDADWPRWRPPVGSVRQVRMPDGTAVAALAASDLARAIVGAADRRHGYQVFTVTGDSLHASVQPGSDLPGWSPRRLPVRQADVRHLR